VASYVSVAQSAMRPIAPTASLRLALVAVALAALAATAPGAHSVSPLHGWLSQWCLMLAQPIARAARHAPRRAIDWKA